MHLIRFVYSCELYKKNIFASGELIRESTVSKMETVQIEGGRSVVRIQEFFNLDVIIAVGYRVNSQRATQFRIWATGVLKEYLLRGYSVNVRMNQLEDAMHRNLARYNERIVALEEKVDFFVQTQTPPLQGVFYEGQLWDACSLVEKRNKWKCCQCANVASFNFQFPRRVA